MNNVDIHTLTDLVVFTPITLLSAMGKKPPNTLLALAVIYTGIKAINIINDIAKQPSTFNTIPKNQLPSNFKRKIH